MSNRNNLAYILYSVCDDNDFWDIERQEHVDGYIFGSSGDYKEKLYIGLDEEGVSWTHYYDWDNYTEPHQTSGIPQLDWKGMVYLREFLTILVRRLKERAEETNG